MGLDGRTPLLLAFGEHPGSCGRVRCGADRKFFKSMVVPFLEEHVVLKGGNAIIIHEFNVGYDGSIDRNNPDNVRSVEHYAQLVESNANSMLERTTCLGKQAEQYADWLDWGFMERVLQINASAPMKVKSIIEPISAETMFHIHDQSEIASNMHLALTLDEMTAVEMDRIKYSMLICRERSMRVVDLAKKLRQENPSQVIVVCRGYAHSGVSSYFDYSEFEITNANHMRGVPRFSSEAIIESFTRTLSDEKIRRYALLSLYFDDYVDSNRARYFRKCSEGQHFDEDQYRQLSVEARQYAFKMERHAKEPQRSCG